jgi:hypothetical protein
MFSDLVRLFQSENACLLPQNIGILVIESVDLVENGAARFAFELPWGIHSTATA